MESRLVEALEIALHMRGIPKIIKEFINDIIGLEYEFSCMDWNDWNDYSEHELEPMLEEMFAKYKVDKKEKSK